MIKTPESSSEQTSSTSHIKIIDHEKKNIFRFFLSLDKFTKTLFVVMGIIVLSTPFFIYKTMTYFSHAETNSTGIMQAINPIPSENQNPGTSNWEFSKPSKNGEIQAYLGEDSINIGGNVHLYVSTKSNDTYNIDIYRLGFYQGLGGRLMQSIQNNQSIPQGYWVYNYQSPNQQSPTPINCPTCITSYKDSLGQETNITDANWQLSKTISFPSTWITGIYILKLTENNGGYQWSVPIIVRDDSSRSTIVYLDPNFTDQAYNYWGGTGLYSNWRNNDYSGRNAFYASFNRPYYYGYGLGNLLFWTYEMDRFMEEEGYNVSYATETSISNGTTSLANHRLLVEAGHAEYTSGKERSAIENGLNNGMNLAYFGANDIYWQVRTTQDNKGNADRWIIGYKDGATAPKYDPFNTPGNPNISLSSTLFRYSPLNKPEDQILKAMYGSWNNNGSTTGFQNFIVQNSNSWIYQNSGFHDGDIIKGILGYEVDVNQNDGAITGSDIIVGKSPFYTHDNQTITAYSVFGNYKNTSSMIFNAGTIYWDLALTHFNYEFGSTTPPFSSGLVQVTNNILSKLTGQTVPLSAGNNSLQDSVVSGNSPLEQYPSDEK